MPFIKIQEDEFNYITPLDMYQDNKIKTIHGVLDYQAEMIKQYMNHYSDKVVALELPTGCGKTLVGVLIGEFRRRKDNEKVVYLCPTNQLVNQVVKDAIEKYGLSATAFCGKQSDYDSNSKANFLMKKTIAVTTYSAYFSAGSFFSDADTVIMDDVHSSEDYIVSNWRVTIDRNDTTFRQIVEVLKPIISENAYNNLVGETDTYSENYWCDMVPMPLLLDRLSILYSILDARCSEDFTLKYSWLRIAEHIKECNLFISRKEITLRPWIPPTIADTCINNAKHLILMSATLGKSGELERITGIRNIKKLPIVDEWDKRGIGRKFFIFPDLALDNNTRWDVIVALQQKFRKSVVLVGSNLTGDVITKNVRAKMPDVDVLLSRDIERGKERFLSSDNAMLILSNRFDGVDFADEACRLLIIYNFPKYTNLQERFLVSSMSASSLYNERIRMRITQAVGRCTRNPSDYSVVCILGESLNNEFTKDERMRRFLPELRAEIFLGLQNSMAFDSLDDILNQTEEFCNKTENWNQLERYIVSARDKYSEEKHDEDREIEKELSGAALMETDYQYALWNKNYEKAYNYCYEIVKALNAKELRGYRSYWMFLAACSAYYLYKDGRKEYETKARDFFHKASDNLLSVSWMSSLNNCLFEKSQQNAVDNDDMFGNNLLRIEDIFSRCSYSKRLQREINQAISDISSLDGKKFEKGHQKIGELLGFVSINPEGEGDPDPIWYADESVVVVTEDKIYQDNGYGIKRIPLSDVREANGHIIWIKEKYPLIGNKRIISLFISNADQIEDSARTEAIDLFYLSKDSFVNWCTKASSILLESYNSFSVEGSYDWRETVHNRFVSERITPKDFFDLASKTKLTDLT